MTPQAAPPYCPEMWLERITSPQSTISRLSMALAASGVSSSGENSSMPPSAKSFFTLGSPRATRSEALILSTIGRGVFAGTKQHVPEIDIKLLVAKLAHGWQVRQASEPLAADDGIGFDLAGLDERPGDDGRLRCQIHLTRQQIDERRTGAAIRNLRGLNAEFLHHQHAGQMRIRADARVPNLDVLSGLFHPRQQLLEIVRRQRRAPGQASRRRC